MIKDTKNSQQQSLRPWQIRLHDIIFEADTPAGKSFDLVLFVAIVLSVTAVILESIPSWDAYYGSQLVAIEWFFTILFTLEYVLRLASVSRPDRYARSFFGVVDFISIIPTYLTLLIPGAQVILVVRILRLLRLFRILKMTRYVAEGETLRAALMASKPKIFVFLFAVSTLVVISGAFMYIIEGPTTPGFENILSSMYWTVITLTTVGYGDAVPQTVAGKVLASLIMISAYGIIAIPTGIVSVELAKKRDSKVSTQACLSCGKTGHDPNARFCKFCGGQL